MLQIFIEEITELPHQTILINVFSLFKYLKNLNFFREEGENNSGMIQKFYLKCLLYLSTLSNFKVFMQKASDLFILLSSECNNEYCYSIEKEFQDIFKSDSIKNYLELFKNYEENIINIITIIDVEIDDKNSVYKYM